MTEQLERTSPEARPSTAGRRLRLADPPPYRANRLGAALLSLLRPRDSRPEAPSAPPAQPASKAAPAAAPADPSDRRALPRHDSGCVAAVHRPAPREPLTAQQMQWLLHAARTRATVTDISMNGVSLLFTERPERGEPILMRLVNPTFDRHIDVAAEVLRATPSGDGHWKVVCRFRSRLTFEQISQFGRRLSQAALV